MTFVDKQLDMLRRHHLLFVTNIIVLGIGAVMFGSRLALGFENLPPNLYSIFGWRTTLTSDHVWIWIGLLVFFLYQLKSYHFSVGKLSETPSLIYALSDLLLVVGTVDVCWQLVSFYEFHTSI